MLHPKERKKLIRFQNAKFHAESFEKKTVPKNIKSIGARPTTEIPGVAISGCIISFQVLAISGDFLIPPENQNDPWN